MSARQCRNPFSMRIDSTARAPKSFRPKASPASDRSPDRIWYGSAAASEFDDMNWLSVRDALSGHRFNFDVFRNLCRDRSFDFRVD